MYESTIEVLIDRFRALPGIGRKSAERIAFHILEHMSDKEAEEFTQDILKAKSSVSFCPICQNLTSQTPCKICASSKRDKTIVCVVERPEDVAVIESTNEYSGVYHVLHGALSPMDGISPDDIKIKELILRIGEGEIREVIMATNPTVIGTATAVYIQKLLQPLGVRVTRIAHGIPVGSDLEYADKMTIAKAIEGRQDM